jgi:hypothetical protein
MALGQRQIVHVGVEILPAARTMMLGIGQFDHPRPTRDGIAQIVEPPKNGAKAADASGTFWTVAARIIAGASADLCFGKVFDASDSFGCVSNVFAWTAHHDILHESYSRKISVKRTAYQEK